MTGAQATFWVVTLGVTSLGSWITYPSVRKLAQSSRDSVLASLIAWSLIATPLGFTCGAIVNAITVGITG